MKISFSFKTIQIKFFPGFYVYSTLRIFFWLLYYYGACKQNQSQNANISFNNFISIILRLTLYSPLYQANIYRYLDSIVYRNQMSRKQEILSSDFRKFKVYLIFCSYPKEFMKSQRNDESMVGISASTTGNIAT